MRRLILVLAVTAIAGLMSGTASAQFQYGMNYFQMENWDNGGGDGSGPAFQPGGWTATTGGAIWISTGGTTPTLNEHDLNFQLNYRCAHVPVDHHHRRLPVEQRRRLRRRPYRRR